MNAFNEIDTDGTGTISLEEFLGFVQSSNSDSVSVPINTGPISPQLQLSKGRAGEESPSVPSSAPRRLLDPEDRRSGARFFITQCVKNTYVTYATVLCDVQGGC